MYFILELILCCIFILDLEVLYHCFLIGRGFINERRGKMSTEQKALYFLHLKKKKTSNIRKS